MGGSKAKCTKHSRGQDALRQDTPKIHRGYVDLHEKWCDESPPLFPVITARHCAWVMWRLRKRKFTTSACNFALVSVLRASDEVRDPI